MDRDTIARQMFNAASMLQLRSSRDFEAALLLGRMYGLSLFVENGNDELDEIKRMIHTMYHEGTFWSRGLEAIVVERLKNFLRVVD